MDTQRPHEILPSEQIPPPGSAQRARWLALTDDQAVELAGMTESERHAWLRANLPPEERLARHLHAIGLPNLSCRARAGQFTLLHQGCRAGDPKALLRFEVTAALHKARARKGQHHEKAYAIEHLLQLIELDEYEPRAAREAAPAEGA